MSNIVSKLKVVKQKLGYMGAKVSTVIIEEGSAKTYYVYQSARTGTQYRIESTPIFIGDAEVIGGIMDADFLCEHYKAHKDFATNEQMQRICATKRGFTYGPIHFANIKLVPFRGKLRGRNYVDEPEKYDIEVDDILVGVEEE